ncbi:hypothetical protein [Gordonia westfalica]|uniref:Uncharacterized protein n=1 Tax=Gordonia westfalica TaxID=158898 RepID=A0A1H2DT19_9ACTN|nr:hypothetical protein [Gordonia westfalica]SDT86000.1 hypothetical protein SAMN04488548_12138 [Gordonia westfalica]
MSVPSLESLLAEYIATQAPVSVEQAMPQAEDMAKLIRASGVHGTYGRTAFSLRTCNCSPARRT